MIPVVIGAALSLASEFLPGLVKHFAGDKAANVADKVLSAASELTGQDVTTPEGLKLAQEELRKNVELRVQFQTRMAEIEFETAKAYLEDRQDARNRDVELRKVGDKNIRANAMLLAAFGAVIIIAFVLAIYKPDGIVVGFLTTVGGMFARNIGTAFDFEFGSSRGSKTKDDIFKTLNGTNK